MIALVPDGTCGVICHDAGGAEVVSSMVRRSNFPCIFSVDGPAKKIFENKLGTFLNLPFEEIFNKVDWILCGTSWQSDLEYDAVRIAQKRGMQVITFLDHWVNYRERFVRHEILRLPNEIWVGDKAAFEIAVKIFPGAIIRLVQNPYFLDIQEDIDLATRQIPRKSEKFQVLYVCEPIKEHALRQFGNERHWGYTEEDALRYFLDNLGCIDHPVDQIIIRPHPSESPEKYTWIFNEYGGFPISFGGESPLIQEVAASNIIVGCSSMAMIVGLLAKKRVISCIPPYGSACTLPHIEIDRLSDYVNSSTKISYENL